jgi:hypothetical protein
LFWYPSMRIKMKTFVTILTLLLAPLAWGQDNIYYPEVASNGGQIVAAVASTGACPPGSCVGITLGATAAVITVGVTGTFSATLQPEESQNGGYTWTSAGAAITTAGTSSYVVAGFTTFRVRASAYVSGVANINLQPSAAPSGGVTSGAGAPSGSCAANQLYVNTLNGNLYSCSAGSFVLVSGGGGGVTSISGDGTIITNAASTGAVTLTIAGTSGGIPYFSSATGWASSALLGATDIVVGGGAGTAPSASALQVVASTVQNSVASTAVVYQGGQDASSLGNLGFATLRGANQTGAGGAFSAGGAAIVTGGSNVSTNAASQAGSVELIPGSSTAATQGLQGLLFISESYVKGGGTSTQWNLQCIVTTTAMTVNDCAASPQNVIGVALQVNTNTVLVHILGSQTPVNASAAVTVGHTVCAGTTAGTVTDSGGTAACTTGFTVGQVIATSGTWILPISGSVTITTTLPLIAFNRTTGVGNAANVPFSGITSGTNTTAAMVLGTGSSFTDSIAGAASTSAMTFTGLPFAGTGTTSFPLLYFNGGTAPTTWTTFGTYLGFNTANGFFGNVIDIHQNGGASTFALNGGGFITSVGVIQANQGFANTALQHIFVSGTAPTIASGFGTTPSIPNNNGTAAFTVNVGTGGAASSGVITMPAAAVGWACHVTPNGAPQAAAVTYSAPTSTTSITLTNYTATTGVALAWTASTVLQVLCDAY